MCDNDQGQKKQVLRWGYKSKEIEIEVLPHIRKNRDGEFKITSVGGFKRKKLSVEVVDSRTGRTFEPHEFEEFIKLDSHYQQFLRQLRHFSLFVTGGNAKVHKPAGSFAHSVLSFLLPKKTFEENFAQAIADMRDEANEADLEGKVLLRRWIVFRDNVILIVSFLLFIKGRVLKKLFDAFSGPAS